MIERVAYFCFFPTNYLASCLHRKFELSTSVSPVCEAMKRREHKRIEKELEDMKAKHSSDSPVNASAVGENVYFSAEFSSLITS